jgi:thiol-disulfide isomerase/thioredoxin
MNLVVGVRPPNLILKDTTDAKWQDFYSLKSDYTILYFWDPECGHCKKTTPKLQSLYEKKLKYRNVEVFAVGKAIGKDFQNWKKYVRDNKLTFINAAVTDNLYELAKKDPNSLVPVFGDNRPKPTTLESLNYQTTYDIFSTPVVYILDKDKKIIAKRVSISQIEEILDNLQGYKNSEKLFEPESIESESSEKTKVEEVNEEIVKTDKELSAELQEIINSQVRNEKYISPDVKLDVNVRTENIYIDGKKETSIHVDYMYEVVKLTAENKTDDFPAGSYVLEKSNAAMFTMNFIKKTLEGKLSQYLINNRKVTVKVKGFTDASPISGNLVYKGEYGNYDNEPYFYNSDITTASFQKNKNFNSNRDLGFLRTAGVRHFIQNDIDILKKCDLSFEHEVVVEKEVGSNFRKISVEVIIHDAFNVPKQKENQSILKEQKTDYESLYLKCKKSVFMIEILSLDGGSQGSGFIISSDGVAISNHHVFRDGFWKTAVIHLDDGSTTTVEKIIEQDPEKDYIVFKLKSNKSQPFEKAKLANEIPRVASEVFAIGNPEGLTKSFSRGEISAYRLNYTYLQTTTAITHGSSGGPLFNSKGEVVGITSGTFNNGSYVYDLQGNVIGRTENGGQGSLYKAINILGLKLDRFVK